MTTPRRDFLSFLGASGVFAATGLPVPAARARTDAPISDKWDMSWCDRINGKVRAVFDSPQVSDGAALFRAQLWRDQHKEVYGTEPDNATAVVVFRHEAIPLVMNDAYWERFEVGKELKLRDAKGKKWTHKNPLASAAPDTPPQYASYNLPSFIASGGIVLACNLAFGEIVATYAKADKLSHDDARKRAIENLVPGIILQPSGGFAALRAQQAGCSYLLAS